MSDDVTPVPADELGVLHAISERIRAGRPVGSQEVEHALETGFAAMMSLEAKLSRLRRGAEADADAAAAADAERGPRSIEETQARIVALREALTDLRTLAVAPGESRVGYGFVLPEQPGRTRASPN